MRLTAPNAYDPTGGIRRADAVIASGTSISIIRRRERPDVHNIPNAVDTDRFRPASIGTCNRSNWRQNHGLPADCLVLLYVARLQGFKNHALLIDALARIARYAPSVRLILAGSGPLKGAIERKAAESGVTDRVLFLGEVPFDGLPDVYRAADIKVISSEYESFCFAAIEAMAAGLPVVTTDCGWVPVLLGDSRLPLERQSADGKDDPTRFPSMSPGEQQRDVPGGIVVGRSDAESLARAVVRLAGDAQRKGTVSAWNREKAVREHGWGSSAAMLKNVYVQLLEQQP
jgi:glycosyltransferase involved in cell wall biosynthesis